MQASLRHSLYFSLSLGKLQSTNLILMFLNSNLSSQSILKDWNQYFKNSFAFISRQGLLQHTLLKQPFKVNVFIYITITMSVSTCSHVQLPQMKHASHSSFYLSVFFFFFVPQNCVSWLQVSELGMKIDSKHNRQQIALIAAINCYTQMEQVNQIIILGNLN